MKSESFFHGSNVGRCFLNELFGFFVQVDAVFSFGRLEGCMRLLRKQLKEHTKQGVTEDQAFNKTNKKPRLPELLKKCKPWLVNLISLYESTFLKGFAGISFELV